MLPAGWPDQDAPDSVLPSAYMVVPGGSWPPARDGLPAGVSRVVSWQVSRDLTGGTLPGQVRGATGMSIGSGQVVIAQPEAVHASMLPWRRDPQFTVPDGEFMAEVVVSHDGPHGWTALSLGRFVAQVRSGSRSGATITIDLLEQTTQLRAPLKLTPHIDATGGSRTIEAAGVVEQLARRVGLHACPPASAAALAAMPLVGSLTQERGGVQSRGAGSLWAPAGWQAWPDGQVGPARSTALDGWLGASSWIFQEWFVTLDVDGLPAVWSTAAGLRIRLQDTAGNATDFYLSAAHFGASSATAWTPGASKVHPDRLELHVVRSSATTVTCSVRSGPDAPWSATASATVSSGFPRSAADNFTQLEVKAGTTPVAVRGIQVTTAADPAVWAEPTAHIEPSGVTLQALLLDSVTDAWGTIREVAAATMSSVWLTETGVLMFRRLIDTDLLTPKRVLQVANRLTDLPWTSDPADIADRVSITATPPVIRTDASGSILVWEATDPVVVPAKGSIDIPVEHVGMTVSVYAPWQRSVTGLESSGSRWMALDSSLTVVTSGITIFTIGDATNGCTLRIVNDNALAVSMVNSAAAPYLVLRAEVSATAGEQIEVAAGVGEAVARSPLQVDMGAWGDPVTAARALTWLSSQASRARWTVTGVERPADFREQLGDVLILADEETDLRVKALITGIEWTGSAVGIKQRDSYAVLGVTNADIARAFSGLTNAQLISTITANAAGTTNAAAIRWLDERSI
ncbi:hypothetical protein GCM10010401_14280 [Rarobacter faecitabidus]